MVLGWFPTLVAVIYGTLLVIVIGWLGQRTAKRLIPRPAPSETAEWVVSVIGTVLGFAIALIVARRLGVVPMFTPVALLGGLWIGGIVASLSLRLAAGRR